MTAAKEVVKKDFREELKVAMGLPPEPTQEQKDQAQKDFKAELPDGKQTTLRLSQLRESENNLRKRFEGIEELAANMKALGRVLQPLLVRPIPGSDKFQIIAGARRFKAAGKAGFTEVPVIICKMTDAQVAEVMLTENLQRKDLHAMEEAEGYGRLKNEHRYSVAQIAAKIGKSKGHVNARLKMLALGPEARKALYEILPSGKPRLDATIAVALARRGPTAQARALLTICPKGAEPMSSRAALEFLQTEFSRTLKSPPFDMRDATLVPRQVVEGFVCGGSCLACPQRSGPGEDLFDDRKGHDSCGFTPCFDMKATAAWKRTAHAAVEKGQEVLGVQEGRKVFNQSNDLNQLSDFVLANTIADGDPKKRTWKQLWSKLGEKDQPKIFFVPDRQLKGRECFKREEILKALKKDQKWAAKAIKTSSQMAGAGEDREDEWAIERRKRKARDMVVEVILRKAVENVWELKLPELRIMAIAMANDGPCANALAHRKLDETTIEAWITTKATGTDLQNFVYELALVDYLGTTYQDYTEEAKAMGARLKVDLKAQEKIFIAEIEAIEKADAEKKAAEDLMAKGGAKQISPLTPAEEAQLAKDAKPADDF